MTWTFVGDRKGLEPIPGLPLVATDDEFDAAVAAYEEQFGPEAKGTVKASGLYAKTTSKAATAAPEG